MPNQWGYEPDMRDELPDEPQAASVDPVVILPSVTDWGCERQSAAMSIADESKGGVQSFEEGFKAAIAYICRINPNVECFCTCHDSTEKAG